MDWMDIAIVSSIWVIAAVVGYVWHTYVTPWLLENHLMEAATIAVQSAEALFGRYHGAEKLKAALDQLDEHGWDINSDTVLAAVRAAWVRLNLAQIDAGVKTAAHNEDTANGGQDVPME